MLVNIEKYLERIRNIFLALVFASSAILVGVGNETRFDQAIEELDKIDALGE